MMHPGEVSDAGAIVHCRRREEFFVGRTAAHQALTHLGVAHVLPIRKGVNGQPTWPDGLIGSITHCHPWSVAAVARKDDISAIGIDLESTERMRGEDIRSIICGPQERGWIDSGDPVERLTILFSAKEAIFKALHPSCRRYFNFLDVELAPTASEGNLGIKLLVDLSQKYKRGYQLNVRCSFNSPYVFACVVESTS
jgi:enterobactin synthetase component D